jgi:hypothetical protein
MSWYILHGTSGLGDEPNAEYPLSRFSTDMRWEIGYDPRWFTFWARLLDEDPSDDLTADEKAEPIFDVGSGPHECADLDTLNRELAAITMSVPASIAGALREEQRRHLAGELGESHRVVDARRLSMRQVVLVQYLKDIHSFVARSRTS